MLLLFCFISCNNGIFSVDPDESFHCTIFNVPVIKKVDKARPDFLENSVKPTLSCFEVEANLELIPGLSGLAQLLFVLLP